MKHRSATHGLQNRLPKLLLHGLFCATLFTAGFGCEDPKYTPEQATPFVQTWAEQFGPKLKEQISSGSVSDALKQKLADAQSKEQKNLNQKQPKYAKILDGIYGAQEYKTALLKSGKLSRKGELVLKQLEQVEDDGFSSAPYQVKQIKEKLAELEGLNKELDNIGDFQVSADAQKVLIDEIAAKNPEKFALDESQWTVLAESYKASDEGTKLQEQIDKANALGQQMSEAQAELEYLLAVGLTRYAKEMKYSHNPRIFVYPREDDVYNNPETRAARPIDAKGAYEAGKIWRHASFVVDGMLDARGDEILLSRLTNDTQAALTGDEKAMGTFITTLSPGPQYDGLKKEYVRYNKIAKDGGWATVPEKKRLKKGAKGEVVKQLKERLKVEGYFPKDKTVTNLFDADLEDAIKDYQRTHQMDIDGKPGRTFWRSLNIPAEQRAKQLLGTMKKWRSSNVQHHTDDTYVLVNLPDFSAEIWKKQEREMRMRVVIGNNDRVQDEETGEWKKANRTPQLSAYIDRVIYNPYWNVTPRIRTTEILVDVRKDLEAVYQAKVDKLLGGGKKPAAPTVVSPKPTAATTGILAPTEVPVAQVAKPYSKSGGQWKLDIAAFQSAYQAKHGSPADLAVLFPYLQQETGLVDVSTTDPENVPPWYAKNGYEVMYAGKSWEYVRQLNGPENALGKVKVIFPNLHDVYLHDTPAKALFSRTIRAYSHGCMRMHQPLDFAKWLLENDGQYSKDIERKLADKTYNPVYLKTHVPVHVVYFTSRVDDQGKANFLIDIYDQES